MDNEAHLQSTTNTSVDLVAIPRNDNPSSRDSNPYAYPYFPCQEFGVYEAVLEFASEWVDGNVTKQRILVRNIESRCLTCPGDLLYKDACGDTALHRLAQLARLRRKSDETKPNVHFITNIASLILDAKPDAVLAQNNWNETPLHQFVSHCGIPAPNPTANSAPSNATAFTQKDFAQLRDFLKLLCQRGAASLANYKNSFPLHDAVELDSVKDLVKELTSSHGGDLLDTVIQHHAAVVEMLLNAAPEASTALDFHKCTPLLRGIKADNTTPDVLAILLRDTTNTSTVHNESVPFDTRRSLSKCFETGFASAEWNRVAASSTTKEDVLLFLSKTSRMANLWMKAEMVAEKLCKNVLQGFLLLEVPESVISVALKIQPPKTLLEVDEVTHQTALSLCVQLYADGRPQSGRLLSLMLEANPTSARIPNADKQLPLGLGVMLGRDWATLRGLYEAYPAAASQLDFKTGMYPFQIAASHGNDADLDAVFALFRAHPSVVRCRNM